jgi:Metal-sensitive transcriptional repressor
VLPLTEKRSSGPLHAGFCIDVLSQISAIQAALDKVALGLLVSLVIAYPVNRWLIARGKGHAVVHASAQGCR